MASEPVLIPVQKLDVVSQGPDGTIDPFAAKALNSYKAQKQGELSFKKGHHINVLRQVTLEGNNHMYFGETGGKCGWFPSFYVQADPSAKVEIKPVSRSKKMLNFSSISNSAHAIGSAISNSTRHPLASLMNSIGSPSKSKVVTDEKRASEGKPGGGSPGKRRHSMMVGYTIPDTTDEDSSEKRQRGGDEAENDSPSVASPAAASVSGSCIAGRPGLRRAPAYMNLRRQASVASAIRAPSTPVIARSTHPRDSPNWKELATSPNAVKAPEDGPVFLADAESLLVNTQYSCPTLPVPLFIRRAIRHVFLYGLGDEGLFRVPGVQTRLNEMIEKINNGEDLTYTAKDDSKEPCDLLKRWCKLTSGPLITGDLARTILGTIAIDDEEAALEALGSALQKLPPARFAVLKEICHLGHQVIINSRTNRMDETAMTILWANNLIRATGDTPDMKLMKSMAEFRALDSLKNPAAKKNVCALLFRHPRRLFGAPDFSEYSGIGDPRVEFRKKLVAHKTSITAMCQVGEEMWTAGSQGTIQVFDVRKGRWSRQLPSAKLGAAVTCMLVAGNHVWAMCPESATVLLRSVESGEVIDSLPIYGASAALVETAVWIGSVARVVVFDSGTRKEISQINLPPKTEVLSLMPIGGHVWAGCSDRYIRVLDSKTGSILNEFVAHDRPVTCMVSSGQYVFSCTNSDATPIAWDIATCAKVKDLCEHKSRVGALLPVGNELWSADWEHRICAWDAQKLEWLGTVSNYHVEFISGIQLVWNPKRGHYQIWTCSGDRSINISDLISPAVVRKLTMSLF